MVINRTTVHCPGSQQLRGSRVATNLGKIVEFELNGVVLKRRVVITAMDRDHEISQASPVGHFVGNAQPGQSEIVHTPGGDSVVKVLAVLDETTVSV